ncbi:stage II sporulation protein E domain protein, partial [Leptospira interrogans serovar Bataviae str. HAI135]
MRYTPSERKLEYTYGGHHCALLIRNETCIPVEGSGEILFTTHVPNLRKYELDLKKG